MERKTLFWKMMQLLMTIAVMIWGINQAQAGPGGGTYYANSPSGGASGRRSASLLTRCPAWDLPTRTTSGSISLWHKSLHYLNCRLESPTMETITRSGSFSMVRRCIPIFPRRPCSGAIKISTPPFQTSQPIIWDH